jgi:hypothetical protein
VGKEECGNDKEGNGNGKEEVEGRRRWWWW